jgi:IPT/TIG domain
MVILPELFQVQPRGRSARVKRQRRAARALWTAVLRTGVAISAVVGTAVIVVAPHGIAAGAADILPPSNPTVNVPPQVMPHCSTSPVDDTSTACIDSVLHNINYARSLEGLGSMVLPSTYASDTVAQQQLIITDEERGDRGLSQYSGLDATLDAAALAGAHNNTDPAAPSGFSGPGGSIFAQDYTPLGADFAWMYDDGPGGTNVECSPTVSTGCWGHRDIILGAWTNTAHSTAELGDGDTPSGQYAQIFANQHNPADTLVDPIVASSLPTPATAAAPDVVQVLPASTSTATAGTPVTIEGNYFGTSPRVFFGGVPATNVTVAPQTGGTQLTADAPADPGPGTHQVVVTVVTGSGSSSSTGMTQVNEFTYLPASAPVITSVTPNTGPSVPSGSVTISGSNLTQGAVPIVDFGGTVSIGSMTYRATQITTTIPPAMTTGTVDITVTTSAGTSTISSADRYTYTSAMVPSTTTTTTTTSAPPVTSPPSPPPPAPTHGYWLVGSDGGIFTFGSAQFYGSTGSLRLQRPVVGITPTRDRGGYWLVGSDGGIFAFGDAGFHGSIPGVGLSPAGSGGPHSLQAPIVGMVPSTDGGGYFMVASDGGVFAFGDAHFEGSCPGIGGCVGAAVAVAPDATGNGYWVVTNAGAVYAFGDAVNDGQPGTQPAPITSAEATHDGRGYWLLSATGQVFGYGDAGGMGGLGAGAAGGVDPATAIFATSDSAGYWVVTALGQVTTFGDAPNDGDMSGTRLNGAIVAASGS